MEYQDKGEKLQRNAWIRMDDREVQQAYDLSKEYLGFLNQARTEREAIAYIIEKAAQEGFVNLDSQKGFTPGQKLFYTSRQKVCALIVIGEEPLEKGVNWVVSHIDSPRLDLKGRPLYEADGIALLKTHYYGGIKKYQWLALPLALHGVVVKADGTRLDICLGEKEEDPVLTISDLLPHLAKEQMEKKMGEAISGEGLNAVIGNRPEKETDQNPIKAYVARLLKDKYGIEEDDFTTAELELVPAFPARDVGLDASMVGGYGQDDRVSAFTALKAILEVEKPKKTAICLFADKEEIGSTGNTGLDSLMIENLMVELLQRSGEKDYFTLRRSLSASHALSADVNAAVDPNYPDVWEKMNNSFLANGVVLTKFTGSRGKSGSSDANPEFMGRVRRLFEENQVVWQVGELGKVDIGGGGTVAQYLARYGMEVVDCGVALLGMHSPFEVASKADIYMAYKAYRAFLQKLPE